MTADGRGEVVLVVEDEMVLRTAVCRMLRLAGYTVLDAGDGTAALALMHDYRAPAQLLITDVVMPEMEGTELVAFLRSLCPSLRVIYMSGYKQEYLDLHPDLEDGSAFLPKPFTVERLMALVRELLDREWNPAWSSSPESG